MFHLKRNLPTAERLIRCALGLCVAAAVFTFAPPPALAALGYGVAAILALTAVVGFCPACAMVGRRPVERDQ